MSKIKKTNAMRILERNKVQYNTIEYEVIEGKTDGISVAEMIGRNQASVFKTLVTQSSTKEITIFVIPVGEELDLKKAAKAANQKKIEMIPMKSLLSLTGYVHGGCSPVGMKKQYVTYLDKSVNKLETMICNGGKRGISIEVSVNDILKVVGANTADLIK